MKKFSWTIFAGLLVFAFQMPTRAHTVELDLFSIGCQHTYDFNSPYWQTNFDLGITFTEISNVYIDWSGGITAGLAIMDFHDPCDPVPLDVGVYTSLGFPRRITIWGGEATYPQPEPFDCLSEIPSGTTAWSDLLDGQGTILVGGTEPALFDGYYVEHGFITLGSATLIVDGTIVPEPAAIVLFAAGIIGLRTKKRKK